MDCKSNLGIFLLEEKIEEAQQEVIDYRGKYLRLQAQMANYYEGELLRPAKVQVCR